MNTWHSWWWIALFIPLVVIGYGIYLKRNNRSPALVMSSANEFKTLPKGWRSKWIFVPIVLKITALVLIIIAMMRPQSADVQVKRNVEGVDVVVALDVSDSMLIEDMKPENRLESAKETIKEFVEGRISDRIGLVCFSGESYTRMPLTLDYDVLLKSLLEVEVSKIIKLGTAIGVAIANSVARLRNSKAKSRIIILLTDGENNSGTIDPITALDIAKGYGMRIYTIGLGKDGQAMLPIITEDSRGRKRKTYQPIHSKVNVPLLTRLAEETGGRFYRVKDGFSLKKVFSEIDQLEKSKIETQRFVQYSEMYLPFAVWGFFLYLLGVFLENTLLRRGP
jgi:Ca-activated chloride channel family protein